MDFSGLKRRRILGTLFCLPHQGTVYGRIKVGHLTHFRGPGKPFRTDQLNLE